MDAFLGIKEVAADYGKQKVLRGASICTLKSGMVTGLLGPNATGKSILVTALARIRKPVSREIVLIRDSERVIGSELCDVVGCVPQDLSTSASLTAFESVLVSGWRAGRLCVRGSEIEYTAAVLREVDIEHLADRFVGEFSGSQCRLVAVTQMFVRDPEVILLNEPTSALDLRHQVELLQFVRAEVISRSSLALATIHDFNLTARYCDELVMLHDSHMVTQGSSADVLAPGLLAHVYGIQARVLDDEGVPVVCPIEEDQVSGAA